MVAVLDTQRHAAHLDTQHVRPHAFVILQKKESVALGALGAHALEVIDPAQEFVQTDPCALHLKHSSAGIVQQA